MRRSQNFSFLGLKNFKFSLKLKNQTSRSKIVSIFNYFDFERSYDILKSKSPCILLNKNINFDKNETKSKMENPIHGIRKTHQLIWESQIRSKSVMVWGSQKKKEFFVPSILSEENFFKICVLSQCIVYWIHFQNIHTFTYQETLLHTILLLACKIVESLQCVLN